MARGARFCDQCGARLDVTPAIEAGDRRVVTALFADLVGYTELVAEMDPEDVQACVDAALADLAGLVEEYGGSLEKYIGDAVFAVFGAPIAHDDDALRACLCALAMRLAFRGRPGPHGRSPMQLRIGLATGEVVAGSRDVAGRPALSLVGEAITSAARLQQLADPDDILTDAATMAAIRVRLATEPLPQRVLRGTHRPVEVHRLLHERSTGHGSRPMVGPIVGRDEERSHLRELLRRSTETGTGHVRLVVGEPGMGKTRLLADLEADARAAGYAWTWARCVSYGSGQPYRLVRKVVDALSEEEGIDAGSIVRRLLFAPDLDPTLARLYAGAVAALARDAAVDGWEAEYERAPLDPQEIPRILRETVERFAARLGHEGRRVIVIDDLHWIDPSSLPLVEAFARSCADVPLILLVGTRAAGQPDWASLPHAGRIDLRGLDVEATGRLAGAVAGLDVPPATARLLHERAGGNPLFVGEIVPALLDGGVLGSRDGQLVVTDAGRMGLLPLSLRALLGARIDGLPPRLRALLGVASVVGMRFSEGMVAEVMEPRPASGDFELLAEAGLIAPAETPGTWRFAHPLFQDAAYVGLLGTQRRVLHARIADQLEQETKPVEIARLAHHRAAAGDAERAIPLLARAAAEAVALGAPVEAAGFLRLAGELAGPEGQSFLQQGEDVLRAAAAALG